MVHTLEILCTVNSALCSISVTAPIATSLTGHTDIVNENYYTYNNTSGLIKRKL